MEELQKIQEGSNDLPLRSWASQVQNALKHKLPESTTLPAITNELLFDLLDVDFSVSSGEYDDYNRQFGYFYSIEATRKANPRHFQGMADLTSLVSHIMSMPGNLTRVMNAQKPLWEFAKVLADEFVPGAIVDMSKKAIESDSK